MVEEDRFDPLKNIQPKQTKLNVIKVVIIL
jgi:hypothetical protein